MRNVRQKNFVRKVHSNAAVSPHEDAVQGFFYVSSAPNSVSAGAPL